MNIKQIITIGIGTVAMGAMALDKVEVTDVKARQRYPWNGLVDIDFKLDSQPTEPYQMQVEVYDNVGKTNLPVKSVYTPNISMENNPCMVRTDTSRIVWNAATDLPNGFKCTNVLVTCRDSRTVADAKLYMIIDLSSGSISYTNAAPTGGWTEEYMTTKAVLRKVPAQSFYMGSSSSDPEHKSNESWHKVSLSKPFYIGVFEVSKRQYALIAGGSGTDSEPVTTTWEAVRGSDTGSAETISFSGYGPYYMKIAQTKTTTDYCWPSSSAVSSSSFLGKLRAKTGKDFDLPTEAQWECACKAGTIMPLNIGLTNSVANRALIAGDKKPDSTGSHYIYEGNYMPNSFGLYDMSGNVAEWCLDVYLADLGTGSTIDPKGNSVTYESATTLSTTTSYCMGLQYNGQKYTGASAYYNYTLLYTAYGIRRVVRGADQRAASRSSALSLNKASSIYSGGIYNYSSTYKASYTNPSYGIRLALTVDE